MPLLVARCEALLCMLCRQEEPPFMDSMARRPGSKARLQEVRGSCFRLTVQWLGLSKVGCSFCVVCNSKAYSSRCCS